MQASKTKGFTLIELMIVVAIIGVLAAIAVPQYQDYVARAQASEALTLMDGLKTAVAECVQESGGVTGCDSGVGGIAPSANVKGSYVQAVVVADGTMVATMKSAPPTSLRIQGVSFSLEPDVTTAPGSISWSCTTTATNPAVVPSVCR